MKKQKGRVCGIDITDCACYNSGEIPPSNPSFSPSNSPSPSIKPSSSLLPPINNSSQSNGDILFPIFYSLIGFFVFVVLLFALYFKINLFIKQYNI